jgi:hypothetical protein
VTILKTKRGRIEKINLSKAVTFNGHRVTKAVIEIDHINYGLDNTGKLNKKPRSEFTVRDIEKFIMLLDNESILATGYLGKVSQFSIKINCPVKNRFFGKVFIMIFDTHYDQHDEIHTITLYPGW